MIHLGKGIRQIRLNKNITQLELAVLTGISQATISQWETGEHRPDQDNLKKVALALNVCVAEILYFSIDFDNLHLLVPPQKRELAKALAPVIRDLFIKILDTE